MKLSRQIKDKLIELAINDKLPSDMNELDETLFEFANEKVKANLQTLYTDTVMALNGSWDTSMPGAKNSFQDSQDVITELANDLGIELEEPEEEPEED